MQYRDLALMLFAVPNGGARSATEGRILKAEGVTAGVSDLILLVGNGEYHSLCIEMKTKVGRQSESQKSWQRVAEKCGNRYVVCRDVYEFQGVVQEYLKNNS